MMRRRFLITLAAAGALGLAGCGGDDEPASPAATDQAEADETEHDTHDDDGDDPEGADDTEDADAAAVVETVNVEAGDLYFEGIPETLPAGTIEIVLDNVGDMPHDVTIEELGDVVVVAAGGGETNTGTVELEPGEYTFYCAVPGHRAQMEVTVTVE